MQKQLKDYVFMFTITQEDNANSDKAQLIAVNLDGECFYTTEFTEDLDTETLLDGEVYSLPIHFKPTDFYDYNELMGFDAPKLNMYQINPPNIHHMYGTDFFESSSPIVNEIKAQIDLLRVS